MSGEELQPNPRRWAIDRQVQAIATYERRTRAALDVAAVLSDAANDLRGRFGNGTANGYLHEAIRGLLRQADDYYETECEAAWAELIASQAPLDVGVTR